MVIVLNKIKTYFSKPQNIILLLFGIVLTFTTVAPIVAIVEDTFKIHPGTSYRKSKRIFRCQLCGSVHQ